MKFNIKQVVSKSTKAIAKNAPLGLTVLGVLGLGATGYLSFKSAKRFEDITADLEDKRESEAHHEEIREVVAQEGVDSLNEEERDYWDENKDVDFTVKRSVVARNLAGAFAAPVVVGTLSICAIGLSYMMLNNRVKGLASALATASAESYYYHKKYETQYGVEEAKRFYTPVQETKEEVKNTEGKKVKVVDRDKEVNDLYGSWFDSSENYAADDHAYNKAFIAAVEEKMANKLFRNGYLVLNELKDQLGLERDRSGAIVGWTSGDSWKLDVKTVMITNPETGEHEPQIYIHWPAPKYIYDNIEYTGRYSE